MEDNLKKAIQFVETKHQEHISKFYRDSQENKEIRNEIIKELGELLQLFIDKTKSTKIEFVYTDIKSFEDACKKLNIEPILPEVTMLRDKNQKSVIANYKLDVIQEAINEDWKADWNDDDQYKYYPWFKRSSSGSGFAYDGCFYDDSASDVGSRRVFPSSDIAEYVGNQFLDLYNDAVWIE
jgi:hypothetical protein